MRAVAKQLGIAESDILPMTYYWLEPEQVAAWCGREVSGCVDQWDDQIAIFSRRVFHAHELVHALHLSAWPLRQPLLQEGLATVFDDQSPETLSLRADNGAIDLAIELEASFDMPYSVYQIGAYLVYWIIQRYGADGLSDFWNASKRPTSAFDFREAFAETLGESLEDMLADLDGQEGCQIVTCVGEPRAWDNDRWTTTSPRACGDGVVGSVVDGDFEGIRLDLLEITPPGNYEISVLASNATTVAAITACGSACPLNSRSFIVASDVTVTRHFEAGLYRVDTRGTTNRGYEVEVRPRP